MEAYVKDNIHLGTYCINILELQNKNSQLAPIKPLQFNYEDVGVNLGQDYYHAVCPIEFFLEKDSNSPCSVHLPVGWVISGPLLPTAV